MPPGLIFAALFCAGSTCWIGLRLGAAGAGDRLAGGGLALCGVSVALGLLLRRGFARAAALALSGLLALWGLRLVAQGGGLAENLLLVSALAAAGLLIHPATGRPRPEPQGAGRQVPRCGALGLAAALGALGAAASLGPGLVSGAPTAAQAGRAAALPAAAVAGRVEWSGWDEGLARAAREGKPLLATVVTRWCPYCSKMADTTWKSRDVARRMQDLVAVRIDAEDGAAGTRAAARYGVGGFPAQLLLSPEGGLLARADGYQAPAEFLAWLDRALPRGEQARLATRPVGP
jgi:thiol:disulfide interchange protein